MPSNQMLTADDLDEIAHSSFSADDPLAVAAELVGAVEQGRIADKSDVSYALMLATDITERVGGLAAALGLAERAIEAIRVHGDPEDGYPRARRAGLLLRLGRDDEAMTELNALRPHLETDPAAASWMIDALEETGRGAVAEEWLTAALNSLLERVRTPAPDGSDGRAAAMVYGLAQHRHRLRGDLGLPHDELDNLADRLRSAAQEALQGGEDGHAGTVVLFWPRDEFNRLLLRWPVLAQTYGRNWDEHRSRLERSLARLAEPGTNRLGVLPGSADGLADFAGEVDDPLDDDVREDYTDDLLDHVEPIAWPPGRNEPCWCGSGSKYKKCCLPRLRS
jgi:SEC-C motif